MLNDRIKESLEEALRELYLERDRVQRSIAGLEDYLGQSAANDISLQHAMAHSQSHQVGQNAPQNGQNRQDASHTSTMWHSGAHFTPFPDTEAGQAQAVDDQKRPRSREGWTDEARLKASRRMQRYWDERKAKESAMAQEVERLRAQQEDTPANPS